MRGGKRSWWPAIAAIATAAAALAIAAIALNVSRHDQALAEAVDLHVTALASANPVDVVSTDRHTVKPWFQGRLPFTFNIPEMQGTGFQLVGGRMAWLQGTPGAQLLFSMRKHDISVFIFPDSIVAPSAGAQKNAFTVESWREGGLRYLIIGDTGAAEIASLRRLFEDAARQR